MPSHVGTCSSSTSGRRFAAGGGRASYLKAPQSYGRRRTGGGAAGSNSKSRRGEQAQQEVQQHDSSSNFSGEAGDDAALPKSSSARRLRLNPPVRPSQDPPGVVGTDEKGIDSPIRPPPAPAPAPPRTSDAFDFQSELRVYNDRPSVVTFGKTQLRHSEGTDVGSQRPSEALDRAGRGRRLSPNYFGEDEIIVSQDPSQHEEYPGSQPHADAHKSTPWDHYVDHEDKQDKSDEATKLAWTSSGVAPPPGAASRSFREKNQSADSEFVGAAATSTSSSGSSCSVRFFSCASEPQPERPVSRGNSMEKEMSNQRSVVGFDEAGLKTKMSFLQTCEMKDNSNVVDLDVFADSETKDHEHDLKPTHSWSTAVEQAEVAYGDGDDERAQAQDHGAQADARGDDHEDDAPGGSTAADVSSLSPAPKKLSGKMKDKKKNWMPLDICELDAKYNVEDLWALLFDNYQWLRQVQTSLGKTKKSIAEFKLAKCSGGEQHGRIRGGTSAGGAAGAPATPTAAGRRRTTAKWKNGGPGKSASCYFESPLKTSPGARSSCAANSSVFSSPSKRILSDRASLLAGMMCSPGRDSGDAGEVRRVANKRTTTPSAVAKMYTPGLRSSMLDPHGFQTTNNPREIAERLSEIDVILEEREQQEEQEEDLLSQSGFSLSSLSRPRRGAARSRSRTAASTRTSTRPARKASQAETKRIVDRLYLGGRDPGCMNSKSNDQNVVQERQLVAEAADHQDVSTDAVRAGLGDDAQPQEVRASSFSSSTSVDLRFESCRDEPSPSCLISEVEVMSTSKLHGSFCNWEVEDQVRDGGGASSATTVDYEEQVRRLEKQQRALESDLEKIREDTAQIEMLVARKQRAAEYAPSPEDGHMRMRDAQIPHPHGTVAPSDEYEDEDPMRYTGGASRRVSPTGRESAYNHDQGFGLTRRVPATPGSCRGPASPVQWVSARPPLLPGTTPLTPAAAALSSPLFAGTTTGSQPPHQNATSQLASDLGTKMHGVISRAVSREVGKIRSRASSIDGSRRGSCCAVPSEEGKAKGPDEPASVRRSVPFPPPSPASSRPPRRTSSIGRLSDGVEQWRKSKAGGREEPSPVQRSCNSNSRSESRGEDGYFPANRTRSRRRSSSDKSKARTRIGGAGTSRDQSSVERVSNPGPAPGDALLGSSSCRRLQDESSSTRTHAGAGSTVLPYNYFRPGPPPATCAPAVPRTGPMSPFALHAGGGQSVVYSPPVAAPPASLFSPQLQQMQKYPVSAAATPPLATLHSRGTPTSSSAQPFFSPPARPGGVLVASSRARGPGRQGYDFTTRSAAGGVPPRPLPAATVEREPYQHQYHLRAAGSATAALIPTATTPGGALSSSVAQSRRTASNSIEPVTRPAPAPPVSIGQMNASSGDRAATTSQKARPPRLPVSSAGAGVAVAVGGKSKCSTKRRGASSSRNERVVVDAGGRRASFGAPAPASAAPSAMSTRSYRTSSGTSPTESVLEGDVSKVLAFGSHSITNQNRHAGTVDPSSSTWTTTSSQDLQLPQTQTQSAAGAFLENFRQRALSIPKLSSPFLRKVEDSQLSLSSATATALVSAGENKENEFRFQHHCNSSTAMMISNSPLHPVETVGVHPRASAWPLQSTSRGNPTASCAEVRTRKTLTRQQKSQKLDVIQQP